MSCFLYRDALFLLDWKTSSTGSSKESSSGLSDLYSDPLQIAAYIGAVNADPMFSAVPEVSCFMKND